MSEYIVSARKYRPDTFETLVGQDNIAKTLKNSILRGQLAHAYLFCGPRGVGKTSTARIFAKMINCSNPSADMEPCGECESCRSFAEGRSYCIHELDAASNNGVDDIKTLMDQVQIPPQVGKYSVYIIDEVHMLSQSAFNAFLKTLEEPPAHAIFILATTEKHKIIPTILSRCQTYDFNRISIPDIVSNLRSIAAKEGITADDESLHVIAQKADGAMRDALTIFDQTVAFCGTDIKYQDVIRNLNVLDYEYSFKLVDNFLEGNYAEPLKVLDEVLTKGFNSLHFISSVGSHLRDLLVARAGGLDSLLDVPDSLRPRYAAQASRCSVKFLYDALAAIAQCEAGYRGAVNQRLHIEFTLMKLAFLHGVPGAPAATATPAPATTAAPTAAPAAQTVPATAAEPATAAQLATAAEPATEATAAQPATAATPTPASAPAPATAVPAAAKPAPAAEPAPQPAPKPAPKPAPTAAPAAQTAPATAAEPAPATAATPATERARKGKLPAGLSMSALLGEEAAAAGGKEATIDPASEEMPEDEALMASWKQIPEMYTNQPRMANLLASQAPTITEADGTKVMTLMVMNEGQKSWLEEHHVRPIEERLRKDTGSSKVILKIGVIPQEAREEKKYMPAEKAQDLMEKNEEVRNLITDLSLDVK